MKKRRIAIASFLMLAVLVMGIGFAAVADNLNITGAARVTSDQTATVFDEKVYFSAAVEETLADGIKGTSGQANTIEITGAQKDAVEFHVYSLALINQQAKFKITIKNESKQYDAIIALDAGQPTNNMGDKISISYETEDGDDKNIICPAEGSIDVFVTVELLCSPDTTLDASFTCNLTATSTAKGTVLN